MADLEKLQRETASERQKLAASLDALSDTVAPDNLRAHGEMLWNEYGAKVMAKAKDNPTGLMLMGAGLAMLASGAGTRNAQPKPPKPAAVDPQAAMIGFDERVAAADAALSEPERPTAAWLRERIEDGLDALPPAARLKVREARKAAITAQEKVEAKAREAANATSSAVKAQPLAAGAIALGIGALAGALLPGTRREDEMLGEHRDRVMARAQAVLQDEMDKLEAQAKSALHGTPHQTEASPTARL